MNYREQDRITLKAIEYNAAMSHETHCYSAKLYYQGEYLGTVGNHGHGGCDNHYPESDKRDKWRDMERWISTLDPYTSTAGDSAFSCLIDLDWICGELVNDWCLKKDIQRLCRNRVLYVDTSGKVRQTTAAKNAAQRERWLEHVRKREGQWSDVKTILNDVPMAERMKAFRGAGLA